MSTLLPNDLFLLSPQSSRADANVLGEVAPRPGPLGSVLSVMWSFNLTWGMAYPRSHRSPREKGREDKTIGPKRLNIFPSLSRCSRFSQSLLCYPPPLLSMPLNSLHSPFSITTHSHPHRAPHFLPIAPRDLVTIGNRPDSSPSLLPEGAVPPPQALLALGPQNNLLQLPRLPSLLQCTLVSSSPGWLLQYSRRQALSPTWVRGYPPLLWVPFPEICPGLKVTGP